MNLINTDLSLEEVLQYNFNSIDTNTTYLQQYKDIAGIHGQKWPFIKVYMVENDRLLLEVVVATTGEVLSSRGINNVNVLKLTIPKNPIFKNKQFFSLSLRIPKWLLKRLNVRLQ